ncbi:OB-fold domain-containing protein [Effusibacillus dendaii]|uniref:3-hydroxy-3-methylglutaryl CoA synthase n=1 Tax=Effusibacillus dendaii TaxID=2743772 RepID=A0A7I8D801_9BACL|nr:OB-fold domain-containing protein [Effusibacillus dendaii]BCJ86137.1 hypothetical protein skT53_11220 [Effusibacillus dendaii]
MVGLVSYGAYIPYNRLERKKIGQAFGDRPGKGEKAVANFDEDSVSLAVSAALDSLQGFETDSVDALYFATTSAPYLEKQSSATIASALDLQPEVRASDFGGSLRAASSAMIAAFDTVKAGATRVLVAAADCRLGAPQGQNEQLFGDGGAAFLIGQGPEVIAEVKSISSRTQEQIGNWRSQDDRFEKSWEDRFVQKVYAETVAQTVQTILVASGLQPADFAKLVITGPNPRAALAVANGLGFQPQQIQDELVDWVGMAGTAHAPMMLAAAMEQAQPGERILFVNFGEGCDAILFEVTDAIRNLSPRRAISGHLEPKDNHLEYNNYLKWKGILQTEPARRPETPRPSVPAMQRNYRQNLGFYGSKCLACGTPQFPKQRVCVQCQAVDQMVEYRFYGKSAKVATFTIDHLAATPAPPSVVAVVDFDGGGRVICEVTDVDPAEMKIGMELDMTFRRLYAAGSIHNYFWKAKPKRAVAGGQGANQAAQNPQSADESNKTKATEGVRS